MSLLDNILSPADLKSLTIDELVTLAAEVRQEVISSVSQTGGHLGSNLGSVELTVALHHVFDLPRDKIIWDVSHQTYPHKLLTGRRDQMKTLRQYGGLAGFAKRAESEYDPFGAGHASTSISAALGFAAARDQAGDDYKVVAVIGDGSMTGLNNAGSLKKNLLVILNDNTWSISRNVGAISKYLTQVMSDEKFAKLRAEIWELTGRFKRREQIRGAISRIEHSLKGLIVPGMLFQKLGFNYFGPIDGHDLPLLVKMLQNLKNVTGPVMLHIATVKGKGYEPAMDDPFRFHGVGKFDKVTGECAPIKAGRPAYTAVFGDTMMELAEKDKRVVAITAAMSSGTGRVEYSERFPERFFDVGIAEAHAVCFAGGMAASGSRPYVAIYSTFLQRAYDQIIHDVALQNLPVVFCLDRGGLVGEDGPTHHGAFDLTYLCPIPNLTLAVPKDGNELRAMLHHTSQAELTGPVAIRYPRDTVPTDMKPDVDPIDWGCWERLTAPAAVVLLAVGTMVTTGREVVDLFAEQGHSIELINARFVKPMDEELLSEVAGRARVIVTLEENALRGGFGQAVAEFLTRRGYPGRFAALGLPDQFVTHGNRSLLMRDVGLDVDGISTSLSDLLKSDHKNGQGLLSKLVFRRNGNGRRKSPPARS